MINVDKFKKSNSLMDGGGSENESTENEKQQGGGNGMLRLPYAIAKDRGIPTDGLTPSQVWQKLKGVGVSPRREKDKFLDKHNKNSDNNTLTKNEESNTIDTSGSVSDTLYSPDSKVHSKQERQSAFRNIGKTTVAQVTADYVLDCVDGKILKSDDLKMVDVLSGNVGEAIAHYKSAWDFSVSEIKFNAKGFVETDEKIAKHREYKGAEYNHTTMWRVPQEKRVKAAVDHEVAHFIDHKFSLSTTARECAARIIEQSGKKDTIMKEIEGIVEQIQNNPHSAENQSLKERGLQLMKKSEEFSSLISKDKLILSQERNNISRPSRTIASALKTRGITSEQIGNELSHYATYSDVEMFAEGFACIKNIPKDKRTPVMQAFAEELDKYFGGKI